MNAEYEGVMLIIKTALGRELSPDIVISIVAAKQKLNDCLDELSTKYIKGDVNAVEYINQYNDAMNCFKTAAKHRMGDLDFKQCFSNMKPHTLNELTKRQDPSPS